jgi:ribosomal protein S30
MKNSNIIKPRKPILARDFFCGIKLNKNQVDSGNLKSAVEKNGFREQTQRHITIISGAGKFKSALFKFPAKERKQKIIKIKNILKNLNWRYTQKDIYSVNKKSYFSGLKILEHRKSYIRTIEMPDIHIFYKKLNILLKTHIPEQFTHITLFTKGERLNAPWRGIPIPSKTEFKKLHPVKIKEK